MTEAQKMDVFNTISSLLINKKFSETEDEITKLVEKFMAPPQVTIDDQKELLADFIKFLRHQHSPWLIGPFLKLDLAHKFGAPETIIHCGKIIWSIKWREDDMHRGAALQKHLWDNFGPKTGLRLKP